MTKVLHIVGDSKFGGGSRIILRLAHMAQQQGWQADVLTTDRIFQQLLCQASIGVVDLDVIWREIRPFKDLRGLVALYRFLSSSDYAVVHTHTSKAGVVGRVAARLAGVPIIFHTVHGFAFHEGSPRLQRTIYSMVERAAASFCDHIVCVSEFHRRWAVRLGIASAAKITAIPNGIQCVPTTIGREQMRHALGISCEEFVILSVGRLARQKGLEYLLVATAELVHQMHRPFRVILAGDGELLNQLQQTVRNLALSNYVTFLGFRQDVENLLSASDLVVLPSLREGLSIALLEAMAAGTAIVATTIGSNVEVAAHSGAAFFVPPADSGALASAILLCSQDKSMTNRLVQNARAVFQRRYTDETMLLTYRELYLRFLEAKRVTTMSVAATAE